MKALQSLGLLGKKLLKGGLLATGILGLFLCSSARADVWAPYAESENGTRHFVDLDRVSVPSGPNVGSDILSIFISFQDLSQDLSAYPVTVHTSSSSSGGRSTPTTHNCNRNLFLTLLATGPQTKGLIYLSRAVPVMSVPDGLMTCGALSREVMTTMWI